MSSGPDLPSRRLFFSTLQSVFLIGVMALGVAHVLSQAVTPLSPAPDTRVATKSFDPETTGSIGKAARATTLDPCALRSARP